ncbi:hypothetical protein [uncultured Cardiobacterium sp.]|uniref:hypothetical protein n=1 Tax=uncultured Cardiobacterium sp. TaxID=417619 RepID=UPI002619A8CC|nr:hypothetical protein [uncultured Cardiobacterium sp.]
MRHDAATAAQLCRIMICLAVQVLNVALRDDPKVHHLNPHSDETQQIRRLAPFLTDKRSKKSVAPADARATAG